MDRSALVLYLQNVRDLEVAKVRISRLYETAKNKYEKNKSRFSSVETAQLKEYEPKPDLYIGCVIIAFLISALMFFWGTLPIRNPSVLEKTISTHGYVTVNGVKRDALELKTVTSTASQIFYTVIVLIGFAVLCFAIYMLIKGIVASVNYKNNYKIMVDQIDRENRAEQMRTYQINEQNAKHLKQNEAEWRASSSLYRAEYQKVDALLNKFYSMNIIPKNHRSLAGVQFLYEFMSTSQANYSDMLLNAKLEEGIQRMEARLDKIFEKLEILVYETRCSRIENRENMQRTIQQNNKMLSSLQRTEQNSQLAAQYAELAANYNKANAYFSLANYLKK